MQPLIAITANDIDAAGLAVDVVLPASWITSKLDEEGCNATSDGRFSGRLSRTGKADIIVRGAVEAKVEMPCARCLKPAGVEVHTEIGLLLKPKAQSDFTRAAAHPNGSARTGGDRRNGREEKKGHRIPEYEFSSEEADTDEYDGETVVLDPLVRDAILLELPNFPLCSESCPGISRAPNSWPDARPAPVARPNPFEALKHLRPSLAEGEPLDPTALVHDERPEASGPAARLLATGSGIDQGRRSTHKKNETKIASTHAAPRRRPSAKKSGPAGKRGKRP